MCAAHHACAPSGCDGEVVTVRQIPRDQIEIYPSFCLHLVPEIASYILAEARITSSTGSNNVGGWKSSQDFAGRTSKAVREMVIQLMSKLVCERPIMWAMVNQRGSFHKRHNHGLRVLTGVWYLMPGEPATPTMFESSQGRTTAIQPEAGRLIAFNGMTPHWMNRYDGEVPRVTIAFEVRP